MFYECFIFLGKIYPACAYRHIFIVCTVYENMRKTNWQKTENNRGTKRMCVYSNILDEEKNNIDSLILE